MPSFKFASATGSGSNLIVTCSDQFAGKTITCTNGTKTYTRTCPSTSPYEVVFKGVAPGTWTVSGVVEGETYSLQVVITDFDVTLTAGFDYKQWVTLGGLDPTDYASLSEVFADEVAVRRLMTIHASADYLIEKVTDDVDTIDDFTANDIAMMWIGLRDYVCDGLTAITGVEAKFLASQYWERYLKDHVPTMTGNSSPYGTASAYQVFDGSTSTTASGTDFSYKFTNPICVKKFECNVNDGTLQGSNDGSTWTTVSTPESNTAYYLYYRVHFTSSKTPHTIQFYGRSLNVSVPVMTSNTAPYGEVIGNTGYNNVLPYVVFNGDSSTEWQSASTTVGSYHGIGYGFINKVVIKNVSISMASYGTLGNGVIQGSNDGNTWEDVYTISSALTANTKHYFTFSNSVPYKYYRVYGQIVSNRVGYKAIQFYGVDYSEREFAEGSTMKYLYDHGLKLNNTTFDRSMVDSLGSFAKENAETLETKTVGGQTENYALIWTNNTIDMSVYTKLCRRSTRILDCTVTSNACTLAVNGSKIRTTTSTLARVITINYGHQMDVLDVSAINANEYILCLGSWYNTSGVTHFECDELWLE